MKTIKGYIFLSLLSLMIYLKVNEINDGFTNIVTVLLWVYTILMLLAMFSDDNKSSNTPKIYKYIGRFWYILLSFTLIYNDLILMGTLWIISFIVIKAKSLNKDEQ